MQSNPQTEPLKARIRQALNLGKLPSISGIKVSGGCGVATACVCCESSIYADQIRLTISSTRGPDGFGEPVAMHPICAQVWFEEAERLQFAEFDYEPPQRAAVQITNIR
jgi:hypothetical protein